MFVFRGCSSATRCCVCTDLRSEKAFAYQFTAQKAAFDSETNRFEGSGLFFIYFLVDEDGDGKFEAFLGEQRLPLIVPHWTHP